MRRVAWLSAICLCLSGVVMAQPALRPFEISGFEAMRRSAYPECARIFTDATRAHAQEPSPPFVAASCYARAGDTTRAGRYLTIALNRGYRNCSNLNREAALSGMTGASERCAANAEAFVRTVNSELLAAYLSDRHDRTGPIRDVDVVRRNDTAHRLVVRVSFEHHAIRTADDYLHAALIMQHGATSDDFQMARQFARTAVRLRPWLAEARWLYAAATDRYLHSIGKAQIFGTQYRQVDGKWTLEPFNPKAVSDAERSRWRTLSVAERLKFIDEINHPGNE